MLYMLKAVYKAQRLYHTSQVQAVRGLPCVLKAILEGLLFLHMSVMSRNWSCWQGAGLVSYFWCVLMAVSSKPAAADCQPGQPETIGGRPFLFLKALNLGCPSLVRDVLVLNKTKNK